MIEEYAQLPSTQELVKQRVLEQQSADGLVVRALEQPAGKGRRGKAWASPAGGSYQTLAFKDHWNGTFRDPTLTLRIAVCLAEDLRSSGARAKVKWPNDVYLREGKLAGVLTEYVRDHLVVGVGLNVSNRIPDGAAQLSGWSLEFVNDLVLMAVSRAVSEHLEGAERLSEKPPAGQAAGESPGPLAMRFARLDHLAGRRITVDSVNGTVKGSVTGIASGVDDDGGLLIRLPASDATSDLHAPGSAAPGSVIKVSDGSVISWS